MSRALYGWLLALHPPAFRTRFQGEMLLTFEDAIATEGSVRLLLDALRSLARQWFVRQSLWVYPASLFGAAFLISFVSWTREVAVVRHLPRDSSQAAILLIAVLAILTVVFTTVFCVVWLRLIQRLRHART